VEAFLIKYSVTGTDWDPCKGSRLIEDVETAILIRDGKSEVIVLKRPKKRVLVYKIIGREKDGSYLYSPWPGITIPVPKKGYYVIQQICLDETLLKNAMQVPNWLGIIEGTKEKFAKVFETH